MITFDTIVAAREAIAAYRAGALLEESTTIIDKVAELHASPSPVDQIVRIGEYLYARRADIADEGKALLGGLIGFATIYGWHGLLTDDRGDRIVQAMRRDLGETPPEGEEWPLPASDPPALAIYGE
jgi:hypothetical protein